ncbi:MAG: tetratricopeptide repeat protein, partial [Lentisphaeria bacterium]|nr:tetratricopeptide repeat protein [Lentisphaeria bacterium]
FWMLLRDNRKFYESEGQMWGFYSRAVNYLAHRNLVSAKEFDKMVSEAVEFVVKTPNEKDKNGKTIDLQQPRLAELVEVLMRSNRFDHAGYVNTRLKDEKVRGWNEYRVLAGKQQWESAIAHADSLAGKFASDPAMVSKCGWAKANILHHRLQKYDEAIQIYRSIGEPPGTLWEIAECYRKKGDINSAASTYNEIENAFTKSAAEAAWRRANLYRNHGDKKRAIAEFRRIMKVYAKTGQASWSHQALESLGVDATGLGNVDDEY